MGKTFFFIGNRDVPEGILPHIIEAVEQHITERDVTEFVVGGYGHFDSLAAEAVKRARERYPNVSLIYLRPYHPEERIAHIRGIPRMCALRG